eukprot:scaffold48435_cov68-Phaeocystis_antarctica.AAC.3
MAVDEHGTGPHAQARPKEVTNGLHAIVLHRVCVALGCRGQQRWPNVPPSGRAQGQQTPDR